MLACPPHEAKPSRIPKPPGGTKTVPNRTMNMIIQESIADEVRHHHAYSIGGIEVAAFDAHEYLTKIKLGALLALIEKRLVVSESDWRLAGIMWAMLRGT